MKRITIIASLIIIALTGILAMGNSTDMQQHKADFTRLWKEYDSASRSDSPTKTLQILDQIKRLAEETRNPWEFYRAGNQYWRTASQKNWKEMDYLWQAFQEEIVRFDEPILTFFNEKDNGSDKAEFLKVNKTVLKAGHNEEFYRSSPPYSQAYSPVLNKKIRNDYEYALWYMYLKRRYDTDEEIKAMLSDEVGTSYPLAQFIEFNSCLVLTDRNANTAALKAYADKYDGKAVALLAGQELLSRSFDAMNKASSDDFKKFRERCSEFERLRKSFKGDEAEIADCCIKVRDILSRMDAKSLDAHVRDGNLRLVTRNLDKADIDIQKDGKSLFKTTIRNQVRSYYVQDTITYELPALNDGIYTLIASEGKLTDNISFEKYTVSMTRKEDTMGQWVYAAESLSGKPIKNATVAVLDNSGKTMAMTDGLDFSDGYVLLLDGLRSAMKKDRTCTLRCSYTDASGILHSSLDMNVYDYPYQSDDSEDEECYGTLITDRAAFNPGETVQFKGVVYQGDMRSSLKAVEGADVEVLLRDSQNNVAGSLSLKANGYGSVAGEFKLARGERNGIYSIELIYKGKVIASRSIRVDDFVLPTFELTFDPDDELYLAGDEISVKGKIRSYSGHSLTGADVSYVIRKFRSEYREGKLEIEGDGSFEIRFNADGNDYQQYTIDIKVVDNTGETLSWSTGRQTYDYLPLQVEVLNQAEGSLSMKDSYDLMRRETYSQCIVSENQIKVHFDMKDYRSDLTMDRDGLTLTYKLTSAGKTITSGEVRPGQDVSLDLGSHKSGLYVLEAECTCRREGKQDLVSRSKTDVLLVRDGDTAIDADIENVFRLIDGDQVGFIFGTTAGMTWANVDVYGTGNILLAHKFVNLSGKRGQKGSIERIVFDFRDEWSDVIDIQLTYFRKNRCYIYSHRFDRSSKRLVMPLAFTRFEDRTRPGIGYQFEISTLAGAECAASIFDKSTETIMSNRWDEVHLLPSAGPTVGYQNICGKYESSALLLMKHARVSGAAMAKNSAMVEEMAVTDAVEAPMVMMESAMADTEEEVEAVGTDVTVRENFANTIAFEPFLKADSEGHVTLSFKNADKLSTYYVQLFAHDKDMHNAVLRKEMVVTIPVKVAVVEPQFLYVGDRYVLKASVSSNVPAPVEGTVKVEWYDGEKLLDTAQSHIELRSNGSEAKEFTLDVPAVAELGIKVTFIADSHEYGADAILVRVPVRPALQMITEAHSAILRSGESKDALIASLRALFVNAPGAEAEVRELSMLDMVRQAVPTHVEPASKNVLDMSEALYSRRIANTIRAQLMTCETSDEKLVEGILACQNSDGGFAWFAEMSSSPVVTATLLTRISSLRRHGLAGDLLSDDVIAKAVRYLDRSFLGDNDRPYWCGGVSFGQYVSIRACFSDVPFETSKLDKEGLKWFRKAIKEYLVPGKTRGLNGVVLGKAQRMRVLYQLLSDENGVRLARNWGVRLLATRRLDRSLKADFESLMEYAVEHRSGGWYYPNAVMPFRGLLETEAYAHVFICDILEDCAERYTYNGPAVAPSTVADGIRLWLMVQKETQKWDESPEFVEALASILGGSEEILSTKIISLTASKELPFKCISKTGNGMKIERVFYIKDKGSNDWKPLDEGEDLNVGDLIRTEYRIWNEENRSFVKVTAPRMASMRPVQQLSGHIGWWLKPLSVNGWHAFSPQGYRSVLNDRTEFWFDSYPEESSTISEEFYVTQAGIFQMPAVEIESLYAPHYRANDAGIGAMTSK